MRYGDLNYVCTLLWWAAPARTRFRWTTQSIPVLKPLLHNTASGEITARLPLSLRLDAFCTVKAVLVSWTRGGRCHSNRKAWQNDRSLKSAHPKKFILSVNSLSVISVYENVFWPIVLVLVSVFVYENNLGLEQTLIKGNAWLSSWDVNCVTSNEDKHSAPPYSPSQNRDFLKPKLCLND